MKNIFISIIITGLLIAGLILSIPAISGSNTFNNANAENTNYVVKFHISGCSAPDCSGLSFCIDGGQVQYVNNCAFTVDLPIGWHTICVMCPNNKKGTLTFYVRGDPIVQDEYVNVQTGGGTCDCTDSKK